MLRKGLNALAGCARSTRKSRRIQRLLGNKKLACVAAGFLAMGARHAIADNLGDIEDNDGSQTVSVGTNADPSAVITYVLSAPGTVNGHTYTSWAFLVNDGTGSQEFFGKMPVSNTYTPTAGDIITATGLYSPFDGIPEIESLTAISKTGTGGTIPAPIVTSINDINNVALDSSTNPNGGFQSPIGASTLASPSPVFSGGLVSTTYDGNPGNDYGLLGQFLQLNNITLWATSGAASGGGTGVFPLNTNTTLNAYNQSDVNQTNPLKIFQWATSYSASGALGGTPIYDDTGIPLDITGFMDIFSSGPEFVPVSITVVPEPVSMSVVILGGAALLARRRKRQA